MRGDPRAAESLLLNEPLSPIEKATSLSLYKLGYRESTLKASLSSLA
jgi:hypothetical protein